MGHTVVGGWVDRQAPPWSGCWWSAMLVFSEGTGSKPFHTITVRVVKLSIHQQTHSCTSLVRYTPACKHKITHGYKSIIVHAKSIRVCIQLQFEKAEWMALWEKSSPLSTRSPSSCWRKWVTNQNPAGEVFRNTSPTVHLLAVISV